MARALLLTILATLAACTQPVHVLQAGPHTWHMVGDTRYLVRADDGAFIGWCDQMHAEHLSGGLPIVAPDVVRDGQHFTSTRDDVDMTWSQTCPD
jgi:hypothetical protein